MMRKIITILLLLFSINSYGHGYYGGGNIYNFNYNYNPWLYAGPMLGMTGIMLMQNMMMYRQQQQPIIIQQPPPVYNLYNMNNCYYGNVMENGIYVNRLICR